VPTGEPGPGFAASPSPVPVQRPVSALPSCALVPLLRHGGGSAYAHGGGRRRPERLRRSRHNKRNKTSLPPPRLFRVFHLYLSHLSVVLVQILSLSVFLSLSKLFFLNSGTHTPTDKGNQADRGMELKVHGTSETRGGGGSWFCSVCYVDCRPWYRS